MPPRASSRARPGLSDAAAAGASWAGWGRTLRISSFLALQARYRLTVHRVHDDYLGEALVGQTTEHAAGQRDARVRGSRKAAETHLRIVSVCSLKALLILALLSAAKPSGLRYAGHEVREYRPCRHR